jgi:photosystem II stability/assembly factor-like uncharacterized protein/uncharacterized protein (DUF2141 family)
MNKHLLLPILLIGGILLFILSGSTVTFALSSGKLDNQITGSNPPMSSNIDDFGLFANGDKWIFYNQRLLFFQFESVVWKEITPPLLNFQIIRAVTFIDPEHAWLIATQPGTHNDIFFLWKTNNGGKNWNVQQLNLFSPGDPQGSAAEVFLKVYSEQESEIMVKAVSSSNFSEGNLFRTMDGGQTWVHLDLPLGEPVDYNSLNSGWSAGGPDGKSFFHTSDKGNSWQPIDLQSLNLSTETINYFIQPPSFGNEKDGILLIQYLKDNQGLIQILSTINGGTTWESIPTDQPILRNYSSTPIPIVSLDPETWIFILPESGQVYSIDLNGKSVTLITQNDDLRGAFLIRATQQKNIWIASKQGSCFESNCFSSSTLIGSSDRGISWSLTPLPEIPDRLILHNENSMEMETQSQEIVQVSDLSRTLTLQGQGFDMCEIATLEELTEWFTNSPYKVVNLYIGGVSRACSNKSLTGSYLQSLTTQGWRFIPTWVAYQANCTNYYYKIPINTTDAYNLGVSEADAALAKAASLGLTEGDQSGTILYYDLEGFDVTNPSCVKSVQYFIKGWSKQLRSRGNIAGLYSNGSILNEINKMALADQPDVIWPAHWIYSTYNASATVWNVYNLSNSVWSNHQRIRQYTGGHNETWGVITLKIDSNVIDGMTADISGTYPLSLLKEGNGSGTVASSPDGINCGTICFANYDPGTTISLTAQASSGSTFQGWGGSCSGLSTCEVTMDSPQVISATFSLISYPLTITKDGDGTGTITSNPAGINCGTDCSASFSYSSKITLTAASDVGSAFSGWTGDCSSINGNTCEVTIDQSNNVKATFKLAYRLTANKNGNGKGKVTSNPSGIDCGSDCDEDFVRNSTITLTASSSPGSYFTGWSGMCSSTKTTCQVTLSQAGTVTATFKTNYLFLPWTGKD